MMAKGEFARNSEGMIRYWRSLCSSECSIVVARYGVKRSISNGVRAVSGSASIVSSRSAGMNYSLLKFANSSRAVSLLSIVVRKREVSFYCCCSSFAGWWIILTPGKNGSTVYFW